MITTWSDQLCEWLVEEGYSHCFFVAGGNIMHLLNAARSRFVCVPVVHEVAAGVAAEYFNKTSSDKRAFAMVTAGPGITNIVTAVAGAWLESRELLVIAGQVKTADLANGNTRQRGIQEIDGVAILNSVTKSATLLKEVHSKEFIQSLCDVSRTGRKGPVYLEICLDVQGSPANKVLEESERVEEISLSNATMAEIDAVVSDINSSSRPIFLLGGGLSREAVASHLASLHALSIPLMTTWNGLDLVDSQDPLYWGRPNTWGERRSNVLLQQADLVIAIGTRLGIQQTGFNWQGFAPVGKVIQVDIDPAELEKGHPHLHRKIRGDASAFLSSLLAAPSLSRLPEWDEWLNFGADVIELLPTNEIANSRKVGYINPYQFVDGLSSCLDAETVVIPCSSGGGFTTMMQNFHQKSGQRVVTNKGLASMGYGLAGAIGASYANPGKTIVLVEGDGGFAQNMQELGSVRTGDLPIKIFIYDNGGYASIRMTQTNYFGGAYIGCDKETGLGLPRWTSLFQAFDIDVFELDPEDPFNPLVRQALASKNPAAFIVPIDPDQTYFPKIASRVKPDGTMESNPLHLMTPELAQDVQNQVFKYLQM
jgi:acetolactate synthase-1/2/3 large subunit